MAIQVLIDGVDYTDYCDLPTIKVTEDILNDQWEFDFDIVIVARAIGRPKSNTEVKLLNGAAAEFAGILATAKEKEIDPFTFRYSCIANNYKQWLDRHLVAETYTQQAADAIIKGMISTYAPGFTTTNVQSAPVVPTQKIDYKPSSETIKNLANLLAWQWYIDYEKDIHFFAAESIASPLPNNTLLVDTDLDNYGDLVIEEDGTQVKNRIIAKGFTIMSENTVPIYIVADGQNTTFPLPQVPAGTSSKYITINVGGSPYTPVADIASGLPGQAGPAGNVDAYINIQNQTVRFDVAPANGTVISGSMHYKFQPVYIEDDPTLIQQMQAREGSGSDGVYEYAVQDPRMSGDDTSLAQARAGYALAKYGSPNITGTFTSFLQGWRAGQSFYMTSNNRMDGEIQNQYMYVAQATKKVVTHPANKAPTLQANITFSDRPFIWGGS